MQPKLAYFPSCDLKPKFEGKSLLPLLRITTISGFKPEDFKVLNGRYSSLSCYGEVKLAYCIVQSIPYLKNRRFGAWSQTRTVRDMHADPLVLNECIELPLPYSSLYDYSGICFILCSTFTDDSGVHNQILAGCHLSLYNSKKIFRCSIYELEMHLLYDHNLRSFDDALKHVLENNISGKPKDLPELNHLLKVTRKHLRGELFDSLLDQKTQSVVVPRIEELKRDSGRIFLGVKFEFSRSYPSLYLPVIFERPTITPKEDHWPEKWNPVDEMYFKMTRNIRTVDVDRERAPNKETWDKLKAIIEQGYGEVLSEQEGDLVWKFRFFLANKFPETSIPKFLQSVRWEYPEQVSQAVQLLLAWPPVSPESVLELLTRSFTHAVCRKFAVSRLANATDEDINLYLYQLVQALRYENHEEIMTWCEASSESVDGEHDDEQRQIFLNEATYDQSTGILLQKGKRSLLESDSIPWKTDLASFLIQRAQSNFELANYFYWFLKLETHEGTPSAPEIKAMFEHVLKRFMTVLERGSETQQIWRADLLNQTKFVKKLHAMLRSVQADSSKRVRKIEILRSLLRTDGASLLRFPRPLPFPMNPNFLIASIDANSATLFKSTTQPALLSLVSPEKHVYRVIFKIGDDLRQDQLVLQMIRLMDVVLKKEMFDLQLTPYNVLAASCRHGFIQFVEGVPLASTKQEGSILTFLQRRAPSPKDPLGIQKRVLDTYIRSCAGYCVITYLLGVGDRHMENIMLTPEGQLFHIDFSFILGNDPKPMAPEVRLTKAMVEAMGGPKTQMFYDFWKICVTAFLSLRRHANLFLTLLSLVHDAGIHDIARDPIKACDFVKERFSLDQTDEKAVNRFASRLTDSVKAIVPEVMERIHTVMQYMRN
uniref:Phosphatidylinositol 3-kinase catalytic subunit type 3 n=2 Tax=Mesocestoides corti TaxID=53468 RepID=A0A5K3F661_MESCO